MALFQALGMDGRISHADLATATGEAELYEFLTEKVGAPGDRTRGDLTDHPYSQAGVDGGSGAVDSGGLAAVVVAHQPLAWMPAVDEPEVGGWLVEAKQFLESPRQPADLTGIGA